MQIKEVSVTKHINLPDGQEMDVTVSGHTEAGMDTETARLALINVVNSGVITVLKNEILRPIEEKCA